MQRESPVSGAYYLTQMEWVKWASEQQPLRLSEAEMEEVVLAVCAEATTSGSSATLPLSVSNQTGKLSVKAADIAASVLIKLLIDM